MNRGFITRVPTLEDLPRIYRLGCSLPRMCEEFPRPFTPGEIARIFAGDFSFSLVTARKNTLLGFIIGERGPGPRDCTIVWMGMEPRFHGSPVEDELVDAYCNAFRGKDIDRLTFETASRSRAEQFAKIGFTETGTIIRLEKNCRVP